MREWSDWLRPWILKRITDPKHANKRILPGRRVQIARWPLARDPLQADQQVFWAWVSDSQVAVPLRIPHKVALAIEQSVSPFPFIARTVELTS